MKAAADPDVARLVYGSVDDLKSSLNFCDDPALLTRALKAATQLREGKTKVRMLESKLRNLSMPKGNHSKNSKGALVVLTDKTLVAEKAQLALFQASTIKVLKQIERDETLDTQKRVLVGCNLHCIKAALKHGEWMPWLKANLKGRSYQICNFYMRAASVFVDEMGVTREDMLALMGADLTSLSLDMNAPAASKLLKKVEKFVGEMNFSALLEKHDIKETKKLGGARDAGAKQLTATQDPEQLYLFARDEIGGFIQQGESLLLTENRLQHLAGHHDEIRGVVESLRALADKVEAAAKPLLKKST